MKAKHVTAEGFVNNVYEQKFNLPEDVDTSKLTSGMSRDGILMIRVPRRASPERIIAIKRDVQIDAVKKECKAEVNSWRKELGKETRKKLKVEAKLERTIQENKANNVEKTVDEPTESLDKSDDSPTKRNSSETEIWCTICADVITNYLPKYFLGEIIIPACGNCQDTSISSDENNEEPIT